jgi:hypothetical protein
MTKTGDVLTFDARRLVPGKPERLIADRAAPGGEAVEISAAAKAPRDRLPVQIVTPPIPAGRYRITLWAAIPVKPPVPQHVGRLVLFSSSGDAALSDTRPLESCDFTQAGVYRPFSLETVQAPVRAGRLPLRALLEQENPTLPVRVAVIELEALGISPVLVHKVWAEKLLARCRADQPITVGLSNVTGAPQTGLKLRLELLHDVGQSILLGEKEVTLKPYETAEAVFPWNTGDDEYGYEARATLRDARGKPLGRLSDYFSVSRSHYKLRIISSPQGNGSALNAPAGDFHIRSMRKTFGNFMEHYAFPPCNLVEMYPRHRFWSSGHVSAWYFDREVVKANCALSHRLGIWNTAYEISIYTGWPGQEFMRQHPELCAFGTNGRPQGGVNTALWQGFENAYGDDHPPTITPYNHEMPNCGYVWPASDELMRRVGDEIVLVHKELGIDAIRWDGHPIVYVLKNEKGSIPGTGFGSMIYNYEGKKITDLIPNGDMDQRSLGNMRIIKERVRQAAPDFQWGYNAGYDLSVEQQPRTWQEVVHDAGIWIEGGFREGGVGGPADPDNTWARFMDRLWLSSQMVIRGGGYPIHGTLAPSSAMMRKFLTLLFWAQGSHPAINNVSWGELSDYARFATRYSQYLFDPRLRPLLEPNPDIHVIAWIRWEDRNAAQARPMAEQLKIASPRPVFFPEKFLFTRDLGQGRRDTVLHLINDPGKPYLYFAENNYPPVQENIVVSLRVPAGMRAKAAWSLSPETWPMERPLEVQPGEPGWIEVTEPRLALWDVLVVSWGKE